MDTTDNTEQQIKHPSRVKAAKAGSGEKLFDKSSKLDRKRLILFSEIMKPKF